MKSSNPKKQRKRLFSAPLHSRKNALSAHLSKPLQKELGKRNVPVRKGDTVKIMRGKYKGKSGKVAEVRRSTHRVVMEGLSRKKADGKEIGIPIHTSNVTVTELDRTDDRRKLTKERKTKKAKNAAVSQKAQANPKKGE